MKFISHNSKQRCFLKTFCAFLFVEVLYLNVNIIVFKLLKLLVAGDIESNPGPNMYIKQKTVQGSFHQAHPIFGETLLESSVLVILFLLYVGRL